MQVPNFNELALDRKSGKPGWSFCNGTFMHQNPYFYKYSWWVFWQKSPIDGPNFLCDKYRLCTHDAFTLMRRLHASKEFYWIYNKHARRYDLVNTPFDFNNPQWKNCIFAPSYEEDTDPVWINELGIMHK